MSIDEDIATGIGADPATDPRQRVLHLLQAFCTRLLPGTLRRIIAWKRLPRTALPDVAEDVYQELALDCLLHAEAILALPAHNRHLRWMRVAERWIYGSRVQTRREHGFDHRHLDETWSAPVAADDLRHQPWLDMVAMHNGRGNLGATARRHGMTVRELRAEIDDQAEAAGHDDDYHAFWQRRTAEALIGLAADLLRESGQLLLLARRRRRPDPVERLHRLRKLTRRFPVRPVTRRVRSVLLPWVRQPRLDDGAPRRLLGAALQLSPDSAPGWLWLFEACICDRDLAAAATALRRCRTLPAAPRGAVTLARARLLEARGRTAAAAALVRRAHRRWRGDGTLAAVAAQLNGPR